jgi:hypothetical protein
MRDLFDPHSAGHHAVTGVSRPATTDTRATRG